MTQSQASVEKASVAETESKDTFAIQVLRRFRLTIFGTILKIRGNKFEGPKKALIQDWRISLLTTVIHLIPTGGVAVLLWLNISSYFIGAPTINFSNLQFAAKLHELLMITSISTAVLAMLRHELTHGPGLPFGALLTGFQTNNLSSLFSSELWGTISSPTATMGRKTLLVITLILATCLSAIVGPSSAIAMIPRLGFWPAGRTHGWLNTTSSALWPGTVDWSTVPMDCASTQETLILNNCPSSGWQALAELLPSDYSSPFHANSLGPVGSNWQNNSVLSSSPAFEPNSIAVENTGSLRTLQVCSHIFNDNCLDTVATIPQAAIANALVTISSLWDEGLLFRKIGRKLADFSVVVHQTAAQQPFVAAECIPGAYVQLQNLDDRTILPFPPHIPGASQSGGELNGDYHWIYVEVDQSILLAFEGDISIPRLRFIELTDEKFTNASIGVIILEPREAGDDTLDINTCLISAGWGLASLNTTIASSNAYGNGLVSGSNLESPFSQNDPRAFRDFPLHHLTIPLEWAQYVDAEVVGRNSTVYSALWSSLNLNFSSLPNDPLSLEEVLLSSMFAIALSNIGVDRTLQGNIKLNSYGTVDGTAWIDHNIDLFTVNAEKAKDWVKLQFDSDVQGFSYDASGRSVILALSVLGTYCLFAILHLVYLCTTNISSTSWDSISEITVLAFTSPSPSRELTNTCAGISTANPFRSAVRIVPRENLAGPLGSEELMLVLTPAGKRSEREEECVQINKAYGVTRIFNSSGRLSRKPVNTGAREEVNDASTS